MSRTLTCTDMQTIPRLLHIVGSLSSSVLLIFTLPAIAYNIYFYRQQSASQREQAEAQEMLAGLMMDNNTLKVGTTPDHTEFTNEGSCLL